MWLAHAQQSPCFELHHTTQRCVSICIQWDCAVSAVWTFALEHFIHLNHAPKALWLVSVWCTAPCFGLDAVHFTESPYLKKGCQQSSSSFSSAALCDQSNVACWHQITQWLLDHVPALANKGSLVVPILTMFSCLQHLAALQDMAGNFHKLHHPAGTSWDQRLGWSQVSKLILKENKMLWPSTIWCQVHVHGWSLPLATYGFIRPWTEICMHDLCSTCKQVQDGSKLS